MNLEFRFGMTEAEADRLAEHLHIMFVSCGALSASLMRQLYNVGEEDMDDLRAAYRRVVPRWDILSYEYGGETRYRDFCKEEWK